EGKNILLVLKKDDTLVSDLAQKSRCLGGVERFLQSVLRDTRSGTLLHKLEHLSGALVNDMPPDLLSGSGKVEDITSPASRARHLTVQASFGGIGGAVG